MPSVTTSPLIKDPERLEKQLRDIPPVPGVYLMRDGQDNILYIGKSKNCDRGYVPIFENSIITPPEFI